MTSLTSVQVVPALPDSENYPRSTIITSSPSSPSPSPLSSLCSSPRLKYVLPLTLSLLITATVFTSYFDISFYDSSRICTDMKMSLRRRVQRADIVLAGTVLDVLPEPTGYTKQARIKLKRVLKGGHLMPNSSAIWYIGGLNDPVFCQSRVRVRDSRLFLLSRQNDASLRLNSSVLRVSLRLLDKVGAYVRGRF